MIRIYCSFHHDTGSLCKNCEELFDYAQKRIEKCPFGERKPICAKCKVHCYKADRREEIKKVMRFAGPKMIYKHPVYALMHLYDKYSRNPDRLP
jgi:hypothetical protein